MNMWVCVYFVWMCIPMSVIYNYFLSLLTCRKLAESPPVPSTLDALAAHTGTASRIASNTLVRVHLPQTGRFKHETHY